MKDYPELTRDTKVGEVARKEDDSFDDKGEFNKLRQNLREFKQYFESGLEGLSINYSEACVAYMNEKLRPQKIPIQIHRDYLEHCKKLAKLFHGRVIGARCDIAEFNKFFANCLKEKELGDDNATS